MSGLRCGGTDSRYPRSTLHLKGEITTIPAVTGEFCPACREVILNREHGDRYSELLGLFQRQVNAAYVDPDYIARVRKKLDLG